MKINICYFTWHVVIVLSQGKESLMTGKHVTEKLTTRQEKMDARAPGGAGVKKKKKAWQNLCWKGSGLVSILVQ